MKRSEPNNFVEFSDKMLGYLKDRGVFGSVQQGRFVLKDLQTPTYDLNTFEVEAGGLHDFVNDLKEMIHGEF